MCACARYVVTHACAVWAEWVVDVILHPWVIMQTTEDNFFKTSITELAFNCIEEELGMALQRVGVSGEL